MRRDVAGVPVLSAVDLEVAPGEIIVLRGANGAGKTTLLRVLATLLRPHAGTLRLFGIDPRTDAMTIRARIGWVGHESGCWLDLTGAENLAFVAELHGVPDAAARVDALLAWTDLGAAARRPARGYSRGMLQRLALARALVHAPSLLLLDEPTTGLDASSTDAFVARLRDETARGAAVVLATHDPDRFAGLVTRTRTLTKGRLA